MRDRILSPYQQHHYLYANVNKRGGSVDQGGVVCWSGCDLREWLGQESCYFLIDNEIMNEFMLCVFPEREGPYLAGLGRSTNVEPSFARIFYYYHTLLYPVHYRKSLLHFS